MLDPKLGDWLTNVNYKFYYARGSNDTVTLGETLVVKNYARLEGTNSVFIGSGKQDIVTLGASCRNDTIQTCAGNDFIGISYGSNSKIYAGAGKDTIRVRSSNIYANGEAGNDKFVFVNNTSGNPVTNVTCDGGAGDDYFNFYQSSKVTITGGAGKNTYNFDPYWTSFSSSSYHNDVVITDLKDGDVIIFNKEYYEPSDDEEQESELTYSKDSRGNIVLKDSLFNNFSVTLKGVTDIGEVANVTYQGLNGTKTLGEIFGVDSIDSDPEPTRGKYIYNSYQDPNTDYKVLTGSSYNDTIYNSADYCTINGGAGNDSINNSNGWYTTINGGKGNDTIYGCSSYADVFQYSTGDGNDIIYNYDSKDKISLSSSSSYSTTRSGSDVIINVSSGSIRLKNASGKTLNITGGSGKITTQSGGIINYSNYKTVYGSSSADSITNSGSYVTIRGGAGNDTINNSGSRVVYQFNPSTDGNDVIYGFKSNDTLSVPTSVRTYYWSNSGSDKIITVSGKNVTLKGAASISVSNLNVYSSYNVNSSRFSRNFVERDSVDEHWFTKDNNFSSDDVSSLMEDSKKEISNIAVKDNFTSTLTDFMNESNQMTRITSSDANKKK